jgi:outer membrane protein assembly factor BamB
MPFAVAVGTAALDFWPCELCAVVPILPTLGSLLVLLPALGFSILTALAAWFHPATARKLLRLAWRQKGALLLLALGAVAIGGLAVFAGQRVFGPDGLEVLARETAEGPFARVRGSNDLADAADASWPVDRGSLQRLGAVPNALDATRKGVVWKTGGVREAFYSSSAVVGGRLYIVGSQGDRGTIHCLDTQTGRRVWSIRPPGMRATFSSPVVQGDYLVCGEGLHHTRNARVICVDLRRGRVAWTFATRGHVECTPVIWRDRVYVGAGDDGIYCLRLEPTKSDDRQLVWHQPGSMYADAETSLAVYDGRVYAGLGVGGQALCVLDAGSGEAVERIELPYPVFSPPSISHSSNRLFVGMGVGDYVTPAETPAGQVCGFELDTMRRAWTFPTPAAVLGAVVVAGENLVFGCWDGYLYQLDLDGRLVDRYDCGAPIVGSPSIGPHCIYVVTQSGWLLCLDRQRLRPLWQQRLGTQGRFISSPVLAEGSIFVGTERHGLFRVGLHSEQDLQPLWPGALGGPGFTGCRDGSNLPRSPRIAWEFPITAAAPTAIPRDSKPPPVLSKEPADPRPMLAPAAVSPDALVVPVAEGPRAGLICLSLDGTGDAPPVRWTHQEPSGVHRSAAIVNDAVVFVAGPSSQGSTAERPVAEPPRQLRSIDLQTGQSRWQHRIVAGATGNFTADAQGIVLQDKPGWLTHLRLDGEPTWSLEVGIVEFAAAGQKSRLLVAVARPPALLLLDRPTGRLLWRVDLPAPATASPVIGARKIYVGTALGLEVRDLLDGQLAARSPTAAGGVVSAMGWDQQRIVFVNDQQQVIVCSAGDARLLAALPDVRPGTSPLLTGDRLVVVGRQSMWSLAWPTGSSRTTATSNETSGTETVPWCPLLASQDVLTPLVMQEGCVYLEVVGRGWLCLRENERP